MNTFFVYKFESSINKTFDYDDLNQLIEETSRDMSYLTSQYSETNYTKYYHYDSNGNIIEIKSMKYGENEYSSPIIPAFYLNNNGTYTAEMIYNGNKDGLVWFLNSGQ